MPNNYLHQRREIPIARFVPTPKPVVIREEHLLRFVATPRPVHVMREKYVPRFVPTTIVRTVPVINIGSTNNHRTIVKDSNFLKSIIYGIAGAALGAAIGIVTGSLAFTGIGFIAGIIYSESNRHNIHSNNSSRRTNNSSRDDFYHQNHRRRYQERSIDNSISR